jgi:hypothetical protein
MHPCVSHRAPYRYHSHLHNQSHPQSGPVSVLVNPHDGTEGPGLVEVAEAVDLLLGKWDLLTGQVEHLGCTHREVVHPY